MTNENIDFETAESEITVEAPKAKKPKKEKVPGPKYPFRTKKEILEQVASDDAFAVECLQIMYERQTDHERETRSTNVKNARGFMSSHAVVGTALAVKFQEEGFTAEEMEQARGIVLRYGKQLAEHFREEAIRKDPGLNEVAKVFSANIDL